MNPDSANGKDPQKQACGKCGNAGHLTFQCRTFLKVDPYNDIMLDCGTSSGSDEEFVPPIKIYTAIQKEERMRKIQELKKRIRARVESSSDQSDELMEGAKPKKNKKHKKSRKTRSESSSDESGTSNVIKQTRNKKPKKKRKSSGSDSSSDESGRSIEKVKEKRSKKRQKSKNKSKRKRKHSSSSS